ncbi:MAG: alkaline phosphatase family protein [Alphaproteobacteria bacterium]|nr:alkaline phosphatase family protein [Alphaproteobacteria bacterium]
MRVVVTAVTALFAAFVVPATLAADAAPKPKLIVAIAVDQLSADVFAEHREYFTGGLKRLAGGVVFPSGYQSHAATETCPGHSTILTGARPSRSGIIANGWIDLSLPREDKRVYCSEDPGQPGSNSKAYVVSPKLLKVPTLGDRVKAVDPQSRVVAVAGKDRSAVMMGGHHTDEIWFWKDGKFVTFADRSAPAPAIVGQVNARVVDFLAKDPPPLTLPAQCQARSLPVPVVADKQVGVIVDGKAGNPLSLNAMLELDRGTADIAIGLIKELKLGGGPSTDVLAIGLSATDYVGHIFGTSGAEMCVQMSALDAMIGSILGALDATGIPYAVVLTADHGGHDLPERNKLRGFPKAERIEPGLKVDDIAPPLVKKFGLKLKEPLLYSDGPFGDWYVSRQIAPRLRARVIAAAKEKFLSHRQVQAVFTADELKKMPSPQPPVDEWSLAERVRASFDPARSGDMIVMLKPYVTPFSDPKVLVATHGSPWDYDRRVPIMFYRPGTVGFEQPLGIEAVDILPTLAALIDLKIPPDEIDGRCLDLDAGASSTCQ